MFGLFTVRTKKCIATFDTIDEARAAMAERNAERSAIQQKNRDAVIAYGKLWNKARNAGDKFLLKTLDKKKPTHHRVPAEVFIYGIQTM